MSKFLTLLLAGAFVAGGAIGQTVQGGASGITSPSGSTSGTGSLSGSGTGSGSSSVMGSSSAPAPAAATTTSPSTSSGTATSSVPGGTGTGSMGASGRGFCPPGLEKKDDNCVPPGQSKKNSGDSDTSSTPATGTTR
jgi:hypothetical protein